MLDTVTLRVAFGVVALCVLVLFYGGTYRTTRSAYSGWWCVSLALFITSAVLFLLNGTALQVVANPMGNTVAVTAAAGVWAGARSLRGRAVPPSLFFLGPSVVMVVSFLDDPAHDIWTGGAVYLVTMSGMIGLSTWELWLLRHADRRPEGAGAQFHFSVLSMAVASGLISLYYLLRSVFFVAVGPHHDLFEIGFGTQTTTLLTMVLLVVVTFSMSALSHEQQTSELRTRATHDGLTGLLNRTEFLRRADAELQRARGRSTAVVMVADLDGFKALNDGFGHAAGDLALTTFADACRAAVGPDGLVGRLGGDEFAVLLPDGARAEEVAAEVSRRFLGGPDGMPSPTVSFGIAPADPFADVKLAIARADVALYQAKAAGRDRAVRYDRRPETAGRP